MVSCPCFVPLETNVDSYWESSSEDLKNSLISASQKLSLEYLLLSSERSLSGRVS